MIWRSMTFIGLGAFAGLLGVWAGDRTPPVDFHKIEILTPVVLPGQELRIQYLVFRRSECRTILQRVLIDGERQRFILEDVSFITSPGPTGYEEFIQSAVIPERARPGPSEYWALTQYVCNPIHNLWPIIRRGGPVYFRIGIKSDS